MPPSQTWISSTPDRLLGKIEWMTTQVVVVNRGHEYDGIVRDGESWAAAARRTCGSTHAEPVPIDLSGDVKRFQIDHDWVVALRPMTRGDLPLVTHWRGQPHVRRWWDDDGEPSVAGVTRAYGANIDGMTPTRMWVVEINGRSLGFVQDYLIRDYPEFALLTPDPDAVGVDYAIGDPDWIGRGLGVRMIWAWMLRSRQRFGAAASFFSAPDHRNEASLRMLEKAGFVRGTWFDEPQHGGSSATVVGCSLSVADVLAG